jgi:DNA repair protein RadD
VTAQSLRAYQQKAIDEARRAYRDGKRAILMVAPTGAGKTLIGCEFVKGGVDKGGSVMWLAHREELISQARDRLLGHGLERVGLIAAGQRTIQARVHVASVQTLAARLSRGMPMPAASVVVFDEAHHAMAPEWNSVASSIKDERGNAPVLLGLTATPERGDGRPMGDMFDHIVPVSSVRELQATIDPHTGRAVLVPCVVWRPSTKTKTLSQDPVAAYLSRAPGERAFCFCANVKHAEAVAAAFNAAGVPAATIHADTPWLLRRSRIEAFRTQSTAPQLAVGTMEPAPLVLCNVYCLTEGVDVPEASVCIIARGCGHVGMYLQMVGRVLRSAAGKERAVLIDLRGVSHKHKLPEAKRDWSLDGDPCALAESEKDAKPITCKSCDAEFGSWGINADGSRYCPNCGESAPAQELPTISPRELHEAGTAADEGTRRQALESLAVQAIEKGFKPGWAAHEYRERFGDWPDRKASQRAFDFARGAAA